MRYLLTFILLFCGQLVAATGDITGAEVETNGWIMKIWVEGIPTNGTAVFGLGTNNRVAGNQYVALSVISPGYTSSGDTTTVSRAVVGVKQLRLPWPQSTVSTTTNDVTWDGANSIVRVVLSDYLYSNDTATVSIKSGFYTNNAASFAVTNSSLISYPKVIANWVVENRRPCWGLNYIEVFAAHKYATKGKPLAFISLTASGATSGHTETATATEMVLSTRDNKPVYSFPITINTNVGFTRGEQVEINFKAYPWIGDTNSLLDSSRDKMETYQLYPMHYTPMDKMIAVVDGASGNDSTGIASLSQSAADSAPCLTISGALTKIAATNNLVYSLNRVDGGEVQIKAGTWKTGKYSSQASTFGYVTLRNHSSVTRDQVVFNNNYSSAGQYAYERFYNVTFSRTSNVYLVFGASTNVLVMEKVAFFDANTAWYDGDSTSSREVIDFLDCVTTNSYFSMKGTLKRYRLIRNCQYTNIYGSQTLFGSPRNIFGNYVSTCANQSSSTLDGYNYRNLMISFNTRLGSSDGELLIKTTEGLTNAAVINNLYERTGSSANAIMEVSNGDVSNFIVVNNTFAGQRFNHENDITDPYVNRVFIDYVVRGNTLNASGDHRADIRDTNSTMVGTWSVGYGVGWVGNWIEGLSYNGDSDFYGLNSNGGTATTISTNSVGYVLDASRGGTDGGNGNYLFRSDSRNQGMMDDWYYPFDIAGNARSNLDPTGAHNSACPRKGTAMGF